MNGNNIFVLNCSLNIILFTLLPCRQLALLTQKHSFPFGCLSHHRILCSCHSCRSWQSILSRSCLITTSWLALFNTTLASNCRRHHQLQIFKSINQLIKKFESNKKKISFHTPGHSPTNDKAWVSLLQHHPSRQRNLSLHPIRAWAK